jgi:hypothetical protein
LKRCEVIFFSCENRLRAALVDGVSLSRRRGLFRDVDHTSADAENVANASPQAQSFPARRRNRERNMKEAGLDGRHGDKDGEISKKYGNTLVGTLRKIYGQSFAAGHPETAQLSEVLHKLNETSLSQLRRDHATGHLTKKIAKGSK